jgi:hypothetical protein
VWLVGEVVQYLLSLTQSRFRDATPSARTLKGEFREIKWLMSLTALLRTLCEIIADLILTHFNKDIIIPENEWCLGFFSICSCSCKYEVCIPLRK